MISIVLACLKTSFLQVRVILDHNHQKQIKHVQSLMYGLLRPLKLKNLRLHLFHSFYFFKPLPLENMKDMIFNKERAEVVANRCKICVDDAYYVFWQIFQQKHQKLLRLSQFYHLNRLLLYNNLIIQQNSTRQMSYIDLTDMCMQYHSHELDNQISSVIAPPFSQASGQDIRQVNQYSQSIESEESYQLQESSLPDSESQAFTAYSESTIPSPGAPHTSRVHKKNHQSDESSEDEDPVTLSKTPKKISKGRPKSGNKKGYPTKNFLATFKGPHIQWLERHLGAEKVAEMQIVKELKTKYGISMKDYEKLYNVRELKQILAKMFTCRFLFRALMVSRCQPKMRKVYAPKIPVFEKAFEEKKFYKIN